MKDTTEARLGLRFAAVHSKLPNNGIAGVLAMSFAVLAVAIELPIVGGQTQPALD